MYIIEDFRDAPMRPLATAETIEEARRLVESLGIGEHAFLRPVPGRMDDAVAALDAHPSLLFELDEATDRADTAEVEQARAEREADRLNGRIERLRFENEDLLSQVQELKANAFAKKPSKKVG